MQVKTVKIPNKDHPITISASPTRVIVRAGGQVIADSKAALVLREAEYAPVFYIPRSDVAMSLLERSAHETYCPYKGDCNYFGIPSAGVTAANAVWTYEMPFYAVEQIKEHLAFYPSRVDSIDEVV